VNLMVGTSPLWGVHKLYLQIMTNNVRSEHVCKTQSKSSSRSRCDRYAWHTRRYISVTQCGKRQVLKTAHWDGNSRLSRAFLPHNIDKSSRFSRALFLHSAQKRKISADIKTPLSHTEVLFASIEQGVSNVVLKIWLKKPSPRK
jgi:hypothetical protein